MAKSKKKYLSNEQLAELGKPLAEISYKQKSAVYVVVVLSLLLCITLRWELVVLGVILLLMAMYVAFKVPDRKVIDIYDSFLIVYDFEGALGEKIDYDNIVEWSCRSDQTGNSGIILRLDNGEVISKDTFMVTKAYRSFNKVIKEKESRAVAEANKTKSKYTIRNPFKKK